VFSPSGDKQIPHLVSLVTVKSDQKWKNLVRMMV